MGLLGRKKSDKKVKKATDKKANAAEAKKLLAKMQAKKDMGDCPFC